MRRRERSRRRTAEKAERQLEMLARAEFAGPAAAKQHDRVAGVFELAAHYAISVLEQPDNTDRRRRKTEPIAASQMSTMSARRAWFPLRFALETHGSRSGPPKRKPCRGPC